MGEGNNIVFAVDFGALGASSVKKVNLFGRCTLAFGVVLHFLVPFAGVFVGALKNFGEEGAGESDVLGVSDSFFDSEIIFGFPR